MTKKLTNKVDTKRILRIALPLILQQLCFQFQVWVDRAMLGHVNAQYFSAVGNALVPYNAVISMINAVCCGTTVLMAQNYGAGDKEKSRRFAENSFVGNATISTIAFIVFYFGAKLIFQAMGVISPILEYSVSYMKILSFTLLIFGAVATATSVLQSLGLTKMIMISGIISNLINIILDWILIYGKFGCPQLGIEGAAYASTISNYVAAPIMLLYVFKSKQIPIKLHIKNVFYCKWSIYKEVLRIGGPSGLEFILWNVGNVILVSFLNKLDMMAAGVYTLILSIETFPLLIYMGFANAGLTLVGQKTGEKDHKQAIAVGFRCLAFALTICLVIAVGFWAVPDKILGIFTNDSMLVEESIPYLILIAFVFFPKAINNVIGLAIRGLGDTRWMLYSQIFGTVFLVAVAYVLIFVADLQLMGVFLALLLDESVRGILNLLRFWKGREFFHIRKL